MAVAANSELATHPTLQSEQLGAGQQVQRALAKLEGQ
eukprot:SAG11_NODE_30211_length_303_cov_0.715686_1_plen_36_part_01